MQAQAQALKQDAALLDFIYQNARMGVTGINDIRSSINDMNFMNLLNAQYAEYDKYVTQSEDALRELGEKAQDINPLAKAGSFVSAKCNTAVDSTVSHLAEMMIQGTGMGTVKLIQKLRAYPQASEQYKKMAENLIGYETAAIEDLKEFL